MFNAHQVPVGRDQVQHIEMARDMANSFNHRYGQHFTAPEAAIEDNVATLPGLDGRKMSKKLRQHHPAVCTARPVAKAHRRHRHRQQGHRRTQKCGGFGAVPDLPGLCQCGGN